MKYYETVRDISAKGGEWRHYDEQFRCLTELQRAKRASEAPWVKQIGNPSSRGNLVMTSAYKRPSVRPYVHTDSGGGGGASHGYPYRKLRNAIFAWRFFV